MAAVIPPSVPGSAPFVPVKESSVAAPPSHTGSRVIERDGKKVTIHRKEYRGHTYEVETTEDSIGWGEWGARVAGCVTLLPVLRLGFSYLWGNEKWKKECKGFFSRMSGTFDTDNYGEVIPLTGEDSKKKYGIDLTQPDAVKKEVERALDGEGIWKSRVYRKGAHQYILLGCSSAVLIPNGDPSKACIRDFWDRDSGEGYQNPEILERVVQCFLLGYDQLEKQGAMHYDTLVFDLDMKRVRGFWDRPGPNTVLDTMGDEDLLKLEGSLFDSMRNKFDPEKTESKQSFQGDKVDTAPPRRKKKKEDEVGPAEGRAAPGLAPAAAAPSDVGTEEGLRGAPFHISMDVGIPVGYLDKDQQPKFIPGRHHPTMRAFVHAAGNDGVIGQIEEGHLYHYNRSTDGSVPQGTEGEGRRRAEQIIVYNGNPIGYILKGNRNIIPKLVPGNVEKVAVWADLKQGDGALIIDRLSGAPEGYIDNEGRMYLLPDPSQQGLTPTQQQILKQGRVYAQKAAGGRDNKHSKK